MYKRQTYERLRLKESNLFTRRDTGALTMASVQHLVNATHTLGVV